MSKYKKSIELAKKIAKARDNYTCRRCGSRARQIHGSHILGTGAYPRLAVYPENIKALCSVCHRWWHSAPTESGEWFKTKYPKWWKQINDLRKKVEGEMKKPNYNQIYEQLKNELKEYENNR